MIGLDFARGTTDETKKLIGRLFTPTEIFSAYRTARHKFGTGDLVMVVSEQDPSGFEAQPRTAYIAKAKQIQGSKPMPIFLRGLVHRSAHAVAELPFESDAMWFIVVRGTQAVPAMCVIFGVQYQLEKTAN
jgi:hypothetical protein